MQSNKIAYALGEYRMRVIEEDDLPMLLAWRNSEEIHSKMLTDHEITCDEHHAWFDRIRKFEPQRNFVVEYRKLPIGYAGCGKFDEKDKSCSPGGYLAPGIKRPAMAGLFMIYMHLDHAFSSLHREWLKTDVFADNRRVLQLDLMLGYTIIPGGDYSIKRNGIERQIHKIAMSKTTWMNKGSCYLRRLLAL